MRKKPITPDQCKDTGMAMTLILLLCASGGNRSAILVGAAIVTLILTMAAPKLFSPLARVWFAFSHHLGELVSKILLALVFFAVVTPIAYLRRLSGKDSMHLKQWRHGTQSVLVRREHTYGPADLEEPF